MNGSPPDKPDSPPDKPEMKKKRSGVLRAINVISEIGISVVVCIMIGVFLGRFLDDRLNTAPWLLLAFSLMGAGAAFKMLIDIGTKK